MGALDHKAARGPSQPIDSQSTRDVYSQMMLHRSRSPSPCRGENELALFRGQAAKKGKSSVVSLVMARMAYKLESEALNTKLAVLKADDPGLIDFMIELSHKWFMRGLFRDAEVVGVKIIDLQRERLGPKHPLTLEAMNSIGDILARQSRYTESASVQLQVYSQSRDVLGDKHLNTIQALLDLSNCWCLLGRHTDAEHAQRKVVKSRNEMLGREHRLSTVALSQLAITLSYLGRFEEAEAAQMEVFETRRDTLGEKQRDTVWTMGDLALTWSRQGRYEEAESMGRQALEFMQEVLGPMHPRTLYAMHDLASTLHMLGRYDEGEILMSEVVKLREEALGETHPHTMKSMNRLSGMEKQREEREKQAELDALNLLSTALFPLSAALNEPLTTRHLQRMFSEDEAFEERTFELPNELSVSTAPQTIASTALLSPLQYVPQRVYEILEKEDDQGGSERERKDTPATLAHWPEHGLQKAWKDEGGGKEGKAMKEVDTEEELKEVLSETEGRDILEVVATTLKGQHVAKAGEADASLERERRGQTPLPAGQVSTLNKELQTLEPEEGDVTSRSANQDESLSAPSQAMGYRRSRHRMPKHTHTPITQPLLPSLLPTTLSNEEPSSTGQLTSHTSTSTSKPTRRHLRICRTHRTRTRNRIRPSSLPPPHNILHIAALLCSISALLHVLALIVTAVIFLVFPGIIVEKFGKT